MTQSINAPNLTEDVQRIWADVLDVDTVAPDTNFFEAGGDSLLFIVLLERINRFTGRMIDAAELFEHSTVRAQAEFLTSTTSDRQLVALGARDRLRLVNRARVARTGQGGST